MVGVPALWQMLERRIVSQVKDRGPAAAMAFDWALELNRMLGKTAGLNLGKLLFGPVHAALGGGPRFLISGGAALPRDTAKLFAGLGMPLAEGYGLTEAAPVLTVSKASPRAEAGQVGKAVPGVEIRIDKPDAQGVGEVVARGPNVMLGYANDPTTTSGTIDAEGWLHTGDLGKFDKKKQLVLVGRQKDVIVSANGENVYPDDVPRPRLGKIEGREASSRSSASTTAAAASASAALRCPRGRRDARRRTDVVEPSRAERHERALRELKEAFGELAEGPAARRRAPRRRRPAAHGDAQGEAQRGARDPREARRRERRARGRRERRRRERRAPRRRDDREQKAERDRRPHELEERPRLRLAHGARARRGARGARSESRSIKAGSPRASASASSRTSCATPAAPR